MRFLDHQQHHNCRHHQCCHHRRCNLRIIGLLALFLSLFSPFLYQFYHLLKHLTIVVIIDLVVIDITGFPLSKTHARNMCLRNYYLLCAVCLLSFIAYNDYYQ